MLYYYFYQLHALRICSFAIRIFALMRKSDKKAGFDRMAYITYENIYKNAKTKRRETAEYFFQLKVVQFATLEKMSDISHKNLSFQ